MNYKEDVLSLGLLENLPNYTIFRKKTPTTLTPFKHADLYSWYFKIHNADVIICGTYQDKPIENIIFGVENERTVYAQGNIYNLCGEIMSNKFPHPDFNPDLLVFFKKGFPLNWKKIIDEEVDFIVNKLQSKVVINCDPKVCSDENKNSTSSGTDEKGSGIPKPRVFYKSKNVNISGDVPSDRVTVTDFIKNNTIFSVKPSEPKNILENIELLSNMFEKDDSNKMEYNSISIGSILNGNTGDKKRESIDENDSSDLQIVKGADFLSDIKPAVKNIVQEDKNIVIDDNSFNQNNIYTEIDYETKNEFGKKDSFAHKTDLLTNKTKNKLSKKECILNKVDISPDNTKIYEEKIIVSKDESNKKNTLTDKYSVIKNQTVDKSFIDKVDHLKDDSIVKKRKRTSLINNETDKKINKNSTLKEQKKISLKNNLTDKKTKKNSIVNDAKTLNKVNKTNDEKINMETITKVNKIENDIKTGTVFGSRKNVVNDSTTEESLSDDLDSDVYLLNLQKSLLATNNEKEVKNEQSYSSGIKGKVKIENNNESMNPIKMNDSHMILNESRQSDAKESSVLSTKKEVSGLKSITSSPSDRSLKNIYRNRTSLKTHLANKQSAIKTLKTPNKTLTESKPIDINKSSIVEEKSQLISKKSPLVKNVSKNQNFEIENESKIAVDKNKIISFEDSDVNNSSSLESGISKDKPQKQVNFDKSMSIEEESDLELRKSIPKGKRYCRDTSMVNNSKLANPKKDDSIHSLNEVSFIEKNVSLLPKKNNSGRFKKSKSLPFSTLNSEKSLESNKNLNVKSESLSVSQTPKKKKKRMRITMPKTYR